MSWFEKLTAEAAYAGSASGGAAMWNACNRLARYVPESFTLKDLADAARESLGQAYAAKPWKVGMAQNRLVSLLTCLRCEGRIIRGAPTDQAAVKELALNIAKVIAPVLAQDQTPKVPSDQPEAPNQDNLLYNSQALGKNSQAFSALGITTLEALLAQTDDANNPVQLDNEVLYALLVYSDETQTWCGAETKAGASRLLEQQFSIPGAPSKEQFLAETVLQTYLRPLFSKSKPASITSSGRKAEYADSAAAGSRGGSFPDESALTKPWKYTDLRAIPAIAWAVREADTPLIAKHWPLFIPVLLTLADDATTPIRQRGLLILAAFLAKFPDKTLHDTGLSRVFEDAVFPTLAFLPSLTPQAESVQLLVPAYAALLALARKQPAVGVGRDGIPGAPKNSLLDRMLREGVLMGYFHARDHVRIVEVLCRETAAILNEMGVHAVKHLKDLIPMLSAIMTDPFAPVAPATLLSAVKALQAVLANCWPRIPGSPWQDEIINALVLCWLHLAEHDHPATDKAYTQLEKELLTTSKALAAVLKTAEETIDLASHVAPLVAKDARLAALFPPN